MRLKSLYVASVMGMAVCGAPQMFAADASSPASYAPVAQITATGTVLDSKGEPLIGATVREKGNPTNGTSTDIDGKYALKVKKGARLEITYVGCTPKTINAGSGVSTTLEDDAKVLDDIVVVGFGTQKKANLTGAVVVATGDEITSRPVKNATEALQGLLPGLQLTHNAGDIETNMSISIRGTGTIDDGTSGSPLILVDGMEADINTVNPQDIETVTVLKDAAASSIYGSRAPFGVILVTTKKGKAGKAKVNYNNNFRWSSPIGIPKSMSSIEFALYQNTACKNSGRGPFFSDETMQNMMNFINEGGTNRGGIPKKNENEWGSPDGLHAFGVVYANTDWLHELYKSSFSMEHNVSISGGNDAINYYASFGYADINGMLRHGEDKRKRYNATGKFSAKLTNWATFNYSMRYVHTDTDMPSRFLSSWYEVLGHQTWPNLPVYDDNGYYYNCEGSTPAMSLALGGTRDNQRNETYQQAGLILEPIKDWFIRAEFNYRYDSTEGRVVYLPFYNHYVDGTVMDNQWSSSMNQSFYRDKYINWNVYSDYSFSLQDAHNFKVMAGFQSEENKQASLLGEKYGLLDYSRPELNLTTGLEGNGDSKDPYVSGYHNAWSILGFFGRINYNYKEKYLLEGNIRYDGSSRFRKGRRWTWSPSVSLGWNIANENFWEPLIPYVNLLKLRASIGQLSNQGTYDWYPTYRTMSIYQQNGVWLQDGKRPNTSWVNGLVSSSLTWEKVKTWNIGLDWGAFNNRLTGSFDAFVRKTEDMVGPPVELPNILGLDPPRYNNCSLRNTGWELQITWRDVTSFGLGYSISANISDARTKVLEYPGNPTGDLSQILPGHYLGDRWGQESIDIARSEEEMIAHLATTDQGWYGNEWHAGDMMYKDYNGDGKITWGNWTVSDPGDMHVIGNETPRYFFGIDLNANYKGFDLRAFFQGVAKRDFYSRSKTYWGAAYGEWQTAAFKEHLDFFHEEDIVFNYTDVNGSPAQYVIPANPDAFFPRPRFNASQNQEWQTRYLQDASYIRCKNLQLGYTLPVKLTQRIGISNLRFYVSVDNLFTLTHLSKVFDPETVGGGSSNGWTADGNSYPLARTWSVGLSVSL